jgi:DNA-binding transcriptional ArsR family regulator
VRRVEPVEVEVARMLSHPLRPRILDVLVEVGEGSPRTIARQLGEDAPKVAYHVRVLAAQGWLEPAGMVPRGAVVERLYRPVVRPLLYDAQWRLLPVALRRRLAELTLTALFAEARPERFEREGSHVDRLTLLLDEEGRRELSALLDDVLDEAEQIQARAAARGDPRSRSELGLLHFDRA